MVDALIALGKIALSALLGGLIGIEREHKRQKKSYVPIGVRTMIFISIFGTVTSLLTELTGETLFMIVGFISILVFSAISYLALYKTFEGKGLTTYAAGLINYFNGLLVGYGEFLVAIIIAVTITVILSFKTEIHKLAKKMNRKDLKSTLLFAIISAIVLPLLPNEAIDPFGLINPFSFWLLVVIISGLSFASYIVIKVLKNGLLTMGFLGGFISAKATTYQLVEKAKDNPDIRDDAFNGILLSITSSLIANLLVILFATSSLSITAELIIPLLLSAGLILVLFVEKASNKKSRGFEMKNPFTLTNALRIAFVIFIFTQGTHLLTSFIHPSLIYPITAINSLVSSIGTVAGIGSLFMVGAITERMVVLLVTLSSIVAVLDKVIFVKLFGGDELVRDVWKPLFLWACLLIAYFVFRHFFPIPLES